MYAAAEPISMTNGAGIIFLMVCCGAISFMVWFFVSLTREGRSKHRHRGLQIVVKATGWEPVEAWGAAPEFLAASVKVPISLARSETSDQRAIALARASQRRWWGYRTGS